MAKSCFYIKLFLLGEKNNIFEKLYMDEVFLVNSISMDKVVALAFYPIAS